MPLPVIANAYLIAQKLFSSSELHDMETVHCVESPSATLSSIAQAFAESYIDLMSQVSVGVKMGQTRVTPLDGVSPGEDFTTSEFGHAGGHTTGTTIFPLSCAYGITWQTAHRGKSYRGRTYLPGVVDDQVVQTEVRSLKTTVVTALNSDAGNFLADLGLATPSLTLVVLSRKLGIVTPVVNGRANVGVVEQRRRYERVAHR